MRNFKLQLIPVEIQPLHVDNNDGYNLQAMLISKFLVYRWRDAYFYTLIEILGGTTVWIAEVYGIGNLRRASLKQANVLWHINISLQFVTICLMEFLPWSDHSPTFPAKS